MVKVSSLPIAMKRTQLQYKPNQLAYSLLASSIKSFSSFKVQMSIKSHIREFENIERRKHTLRIEYTEIRVKLESKVVLLVLPYYPLEIAFHRDLLCGEMKEKMKKS